MSSFFSGNWGWSWNYWCLKSSQESLAVLPNHRVHLILTFTNLAAADWLVLIPFYFDNALKWRWSVFSFKRILIIIIKKKLTGFFLYLLSLRFGTKASVCALAVIAENLICCWYSGNVLRYWRDLALKSENQPLTEEFHPARVMHIMDYLMFSNDQNASCCFWLSNYV